MAFHSYIIINKPHTHMCRGVLLAMQVVAIKSHCSATVQRCIHNSSGYSYSPEEPIRALSSVSRCTIDHGDDIPMSVKSRRCRAFRTDLVSREYVTYSLDKMTIRSIQKNDDARLRCRTIDGNRNPSIL